MVHKGNLRVPTETAVLVVGAGGMIGSALAADPATKRDGNPYDAWISMYSGPEYLDGVREATAQLDRVFEARGGAARIDPLTATFREATRLESRFWQMGLDAA